MAEVMGAGGSWDGRNGMPRGGSGDCGNDVDDEGSVPPGFLQYFLLVMPLSKRHRG